MFTKLCLLLSLILSPSDGFIFSSGHRLETYNVDHSQISVSGISSGAAMATQIHVIFSKEIMGAGLIAGVPFACAEFSVVACMKTPALVLPSSLHATTSSGALVGNIDSTSHLAHDRVYIYNGLADSVVNPGIGPKIASFYDFFISDNRNIFTEFGINSEHGQITNNYGGACATLSSSNYINNCNYSAAFHALNFIYGGNLQEPSSTALASGQLLEFSQDDFFYLSPPSTYSMDNTGYIYVPSGCADKTKRCKLHVAFHGCAMGRTSIGQDYVKHGGYNEVGELNDIIILYPQVIKTTTNPNGCWDWFGYTGTLFATNIGFQPTAIRRMYHKVAGI